MAFIAGVAAMGALVALAQVYEVFPGDEWALLELRQWRAGWLDTAAISIAELFWDNLGLVIVPPLALAVSLMVWVGRAEALLVALTPLAPLANLGLKELAARPRPRCGPGPAGRDGIRLPQRPCRLCRCFPGGGNLRAERHQHTRQQPLAPSLFTDRSSRTGAADTGHWRIPRVPGSALAQRRHWRLPVWGAVPRGAGNRASVCSKEALAHCKSCNFHSCVHWHRCRHARLEE